METPKARPVVVAHTKSNCRRKTLDFLRLFRGGYFKERSVKTLTNPSRHKEYERIISQEMWPSSRFTFHLICRLSRKLICAASISLLFICTDCQRDFVRTSSFPYVSNESNLSLEASHRKSSSVFDISFCALILIILGRDLSFQP